MSRVNNVVEMPKAKPAPAPETPAPMSPDEVSRALAIIRRFYGEGAVIRNWGPDPKRLMLHVESDRDIGSAYHECVGLLLCEFVRDFISLDETTPGRRIWGNAKLAYRQGVVLTEP